MAYATASDLRNRTTERALKDLDDALLNVHLSDASETVDSYIRGRGYDTPLTVVSNDVKSNVCKIALYTALTARGFNPSSDADNAVRTGYEDALSWLRDVAKGSVNFALTTTARTSVGIIEVYSPAPSTDRDW